MNISDIAKLAGVSRAAVSRYLNQGYLSEEKSERIRRVIEETGYVPSTQAQMLRTKKSRLLGVIVPKISSEAVSRIMDGITVTAEARGYQTLLANTDNRPEKELEYLNLFSNKQVDGVIFIATMFTDKHKKMLADMKLPLVLTGQQLAGYSCIYHDDYGGSLELVRLMVEAGCKRIGFIGVDDSDLAAGLGRRQGYMAALQAAGLPVREELMRKGAFSMENGSENMGLLLREEPELDGVFCATDSIAVGAMSCLRARGIRVPEQISVTGVGDTRMSRVVTPGLATLHLYYKTSGIEACRLLIDKIDGRNTAIQERKLGYEIIRRDSVKKIGQI